MATVMQKLIGIPKKNNQTNLTYNKDDWGLQLFYFPMENQGEKNSCPSR
jgi:hypothetical protein